MDQALEHLRYNTQRDLYLFLTETCKTLVDRVMKDCGVVLYDGFLHVGVPMGYTSEYVRDCSTYIVVSGCLDQTIDRCIRESARIAGEIKKQSQKFQNPRAAIRVSNIQDSGLNVYGDYVRILWEVTNQPVAT